jgi:ribosomal protein L17
MQGRKNVHGKAGVRFKAPYTASKNKSMLRNVVSELIVNGSVKVTSGVTPD